MAKKIRVSGTIIPSDYQDIYDWFGIEATSPKKINKVLDTLNNGEEVEIEINSPGGDVFSGSEIYTALKSYGGNVIVKIVGIAASAASVIAMAGNKVIISPTAQIMIHNVSSFAVGDYRDMQHSAEVLENYNKSIASSYQLKTGMNQAELLELMNKETWLNAQQAKEKGFADEIMFDNNLKLSASASLSIMLPEPVINKIKNLIINDKEKALIAQEKEQLELLNLKFRGIK